jgi:hypothetical protein
MTIGQMLKFLQENQVFRFQSPQKHKKYRTVQDTRSVPFVFLW